MFITSSQHSSTAVLSANKEADKKTQNGSIVHIGHNPNVVDLRGPKLI